jgi:hypothetical protein
MSLIRRIFGLLACGDCIIRFRLPAQTAGATLIEIGESPRLPRSAAYCQK